MIVRQGEHAASSPVAVVERGVYLDLPEDAYHADPVPDGSLSWSGSKRLLPPSAPAIFAYEREHGREEKRQFDIGKAAHRLVLGSGPDLVELPFENLRTKAAQDADAEARARGAVPLKSDDYAAVHAMADVLRAHPVAGVVFSPERGEREASLFDFDDLTGVMLRSRFDLLPTSPLPSGRWAIVDYKTTKSADPHSFSRSAAEYGYDGQAAWYSDLAVSLELVPDDVAFVFVAQEKTPPYLVSVVQWTEADLRVGRARNRRAIDVYASCAESGIWPGYGDDVSVISLPPWVLRQYEESLA